MPPQDAETRLAVAISEINNKIGILIVKQEEMAENISKIKEAIYDPQQGLFSRLQELEIWKGNFTEYFQEKISYHTIKEGEVRMTQVEETIKAIKKIQWLVIGTAVTTITTLIIKHFVLT